jgi:hypothetical protein
MSYALCYAACFGCRRIFAFNPLYVPSILFEGEREPICQSCVEAVNPRRIANGLPPIVPRPDAYQACD